MRKRSNGEGTIFKRADGRWCAAYFDKEYYRHYVYGKTQKEIREDGAVLLVVKIRKKQWSFGILCIQIKMLPHYVLMVLKA